MLEWEKKKRTKEKGEKMTLIEEISNWISSRTTIPIEYVKLAVTTIVILLIASIVKKLLELLYRQFVKDPKKRYIYNQKKNLTIMIIVIATCLLIWNNHISGLIILISFLSAGIAIAVRDIIMNFFAGIYLRTVKPFNLEDRIEINGMRGDVVKMSALSFEMLELGERVNGEQSTGRIIHIPNSQLFTYSLKNYNTAFKYIWNEITVRVGLDADIDETKRVLYEIIEKNDTIKETPKKMESQVEDASLDYIIYFNHVRPIIYTKIVESHVELYIRYLVTPKKARNVEDAINRDILEAYRNKEIQLFKE